MVTENSTLEWDLHHDIIAEFLKYASPAVLARCACVDHSWKEAASIADIRGAFIRVWKTCIDWPEKQQSWTGTPERQWDTNRWGTDGDKLIALADSSKIEVWDFTEDKRVMVLDGRRIIVASMCFARGYLLLGTWLPMMWDTEGVITAYDLASSNIEARFGLNYVPELLQSMDGIVACGHGRKIEIYKQEDFSLQATLHGTDPAQEFSNICFTMHKQTLASTFRGSPTIELWGADHDEVGNPNPRSWRLVGVLHGHKQVQLPGEDGCVLCFDACDGVLVSAATDKTVRVWDLESQTCTRVIHNERFYIYDISFNGSVILGASEHPGWINGDGQRKAVLWSTGKDESLAKESTFVLSGFRRNVWCGLRHVIIRRNDRFYLSEIDLE